MATQAAAKIKTVNGPWVLPEGWEWVPLGEICDITIGGTPSRSNSDYWGPGHTWVSIADLDGDAVTDTREQITDLGVVNSNVKEIEPGTVLMSFKLTIGKLGIAGKKLFTNEAIAALPLKSSWEKSVESSFLFHALRTVPLGEEADIAVKGKTLNKKKLARILLPIPFPYNPIQSYEVQHRIVARIEALLAEVKRAREILEQMRRAAGRVMDSALQELVNLLPPTRRPLIEVIESKPRNGWSPKCDDNPKGIPVLKLGAVLSFRYNPDEFKRTSVPVDYNAHYWLQPNDILISRSNTLDLVGHASMYTGWPSPCIYPDLLMRIRVNTSEADRKFLVYWLRTNEVRSYIKPRASGASPTMKKIKQDDVCNIPFPVIGIDEQRHWTSHLDSMQSKVDEMTESLEKDEQLLDQLEQSILERAFRGEL